MSFVASFPLPIPLFGIQLRGRHNPHIIALTRNNLVHVEIDVDTGTQRVVVEGEPSIGWKGEIALKSFVDEVSERLEEKLDIHVRYRANVFHVAGVYAVLTYAIVKAISELGGYEMSDDEIAKAANDIDEAAGVALDYIDGCRTAIAKNTSLVYRRGEEPLTIRLDGAKLEVAGEEELGRIVEDELPDELHTALSRLVGLTVVVVSRSLINSGWEWLVENWETYSRVENSVYYMLFGVEPPPERCKWTPGLHSVQGVCINAGFGVAVELK